MAFTYIESDISDLRDNLRSRHLKDANCTLHNIEEFPDWFTSKPPRYDYVAICLLLTLYIYVGLTIVCDDFCIPALERISYALKMSYDVAGATLLAAASSAPELFAHLYATFLTEGDMGIGTIVGSAVLNSIAIIAISGIYSGAGICLDWWPITRDIIWYTIGVTVLTIFIYDSRVEWYESLTMVLLFIVNITCLIVDRRIQRFRNPNRQCPCYCFVPPGEVVDLEKTFADEVEDVKMPFNFRRWPMEPSCTNKVLWVLSYPFQCIFFLTIPNIRRPCSRKCAVLSLILSIIWIGIITYFVSWMLTVVGFHLFVPDSVMGITLLALGASLPELIIAIIVTKKGYGSMAACTAISSNSIDIYLSLGLPWLMKAIMNKNGKKFVKVLSESLFKSTGILILTAGVTYLCLLLARFRINNGTGVLCIFMYFSFVIISVSIETSQYATISKRICAVPNS